jgi:hypothetical protein
MTFWLRRLFRRTPLLYRSYVRLTGRGRPDLFPTRQVDLFITSFGRSGNTFCRHLIAECFPNLRLASHGQQIATLKMALANDVPVIVTLREPLGVCASSLVRFDVPTEEQDAYVRRLLIEWIDYYTFVLIHQEQMTVLPFDVVTREPETVIRAVKAMGFAPDPTVTPAEAYRRVQEQFHRSELPPEQHCIPNEIKRARKAAIEDRLGEHPLIRPAQDLYQRLLAALPARETAPRRRARSA